MWQSRKKEHVSDEDAELRSLANAYSSKLKGSNEPVVKTETSSPPKTSFNSPSPSVTTTSQPSISPETLTESSPDDIIQGNSFSYTRTEVKLYANEEPCDTWRHFDEWFHHHLPQHMGSDYYRYGVRRSPVPYWKELTFCIGTKSMTPIEAKIAIGRRRHEKLARLRQQGCSEDIWEIRKEPLQNPFPLARAQLTSEDLQKGQLT